MGPRLCIPFVATLARPMVALARSRAALGGHGAVAEILIISDMIRVGKGVQATARGRSGKNQRPLGARETAQTALVCVRELNTRSRVPFSTSWDQFLSYGIHAEVTVL